MNKLSNDIPTLIRDAIADLCKAERRKDVTIDMNDWFSPSGKTCYMCLAGAGLSSSALLAVLSSWGDLAHDETKGFCQRFCPKAWILTQVSWDSENMRFVYILDCGQHVADSVKITEWLEFLSANS